MLFIAVDHHQKMEYRKIIEFGKSSYVVSLPKEWMTAKKLKKGDVVYVDQQGDKLVLYPSDMKKAKVPKKITIDVTNMTQQEVRLRLISNYIRNFNEITLVAENMKSRARDIRNIIHDLMALEVIEEDARKIVTRDFLNMEDISPIELLKKMDIITREMLIDSKNSFKEDKSDNIAERDYDVNRLAYLIFRTMRYLQYNPAAARKKRINHDQFLVMWAAAAKIENVADQAKRLANLMRRVKLHKQEQEEFYKLYSAVEKYYLDAMETLYAYDADKAFKLIAKQRRLVKQCRDFYRQNWDHEWVPVLLEKLKAMIAETKVMLTNVCDMER